MNKSKKPVLRPDGMASMYWICFVLSEFLDKDISKVFTDLVNISASVGLLPDCEKCIRYYLVQCGAERKEYKGRQRPTLGDLCAVTNRPDLERILVFEGECFPTCIERYSDGYRVVSDSDGYQEKYCGMGYYLKSAYLSPHRNNYKLRGKSYSQNVREQGDQSISNERRQKKLKEKPVEFFNPNPCGNLIGDCGTRAICAALNLPWKETVRCVADCAFRKKIAYKSAYEAALLEKGFTAHEPLIRNGKKVSVKEYLNECEEQGFYRNRICFSVSGGSHMVTARLMGDKYQLLDTWDSSGRKIAKYWVSKK